MSTLALTQMIPAWPGLEDLFLYALLLNNSMTYFAKSQFRFKHGKAFFDLHLVGRL